MATIIIVTLIKSKICEGFTSIGLPIELNDQNKFVDADGTQKYRIHLGTSVVVKENGVFFGQESQMLHADIIVRNMAANTHISNISTRLAFTGAIDRLGNFAKNAKNWLYVPREAFEIHGTLGSARSLHKLRNAITKLNTELSSENFNGYLLRCNNETYCHTHMTTVPSTGSCASCNPGSPLYIESKQNLMLRVKNLSVEISGLLPLTSQQVVLPNVHVSEQNVAMAGCWAAAYQWAVVALRLVQRLLNNETGLDESCFLNYSVDELLLSSVQMCALLCDIKVVLENPATSCEQWMHKKALSLASQFGIAVVAAAPLCGGNEGVFGFSGKLNWIGNSPTLYRTLSGTDFGLFGCGANNERLQMSNTGENPCNLIMHKAAWMAYSDTLIKNNVINNMEQKFQQCEIVIDKICNKIVFWITDKHGLLIGIRTIRRKLLSCCSAKRLLTLDPTVDIGLAAGGRASLSLRVGSFLAWENDDIISVKNHAPNDVKQISSSEDLCNWLKQEFPDYVNLEKILQWRIRSKLEYFLVDKKSDKFLLDGPYRCWRELMPPAPLNTRNITYICNLPMVLNADELRLSNNTGTIYYSVSMPTWASNAKKAAVKQSLHRTCLKLVHVLKDGRSETQYVEQMHGWCVVL